jgi:hypothetical protein
LSRQGTHRRDQDIFDVEGGQVRTRAAVSEHTTTEHTQKKK